MNAIDFINEISGHHKKKGYNFKKQPFNHSFSRFP